MNKNVKNMQEIWKDVKDYEGIYQVSNLGNVKSLSREVLKKGKYPFTCKEKILKHIINGDGYYCVNLYLNKKSKTFTIHQLVAMVFLNHKPCGFELVIDHINDNKIDNRLDNLQIVTQRFNSYKTQGKNTSKYKGVSWDKITKKWITYIYINGKNKSLGYFINEEEANIAYQNKLKEII